MTTKKENGVFYTRRSPFERAPFREWMKAIPNFSERTLAEPFAGENAIPEMLLNLGNRWLCQDISPPKKNLRPDLHVDKGDSLQKYPWQDRSVVVITNPPYLAKNAAKRTGLRYNSSTRKTPQLQWGDGRLC